ncbi:MAG: sarcosine oxidase subunit gamma [Flavobacterium sp.]|nr:sarcosine oxidase subunit gamma [Aeromicrobium sp.]
MAMRRSPLGAARLAVSGPDLELYDVPFRTLIDVRGGAGAAVADAHVWQLGPDWWLVDAEPDSAPALEAALVAELRSVVGAGCSVVDVSSHRTVFVLSGSDALMVLSYGCSIDLESVAVGGCVQGALAQTQVAIGRVAQDEWRVYPRASFARHLAAWLTDAAVEHAHP